MSKRSDKPRPDFREALLAALLPRLAASTEERPTVRCWSEPALQAELLAIRSELQGRGISVPMAAVQLIEWLQEIKLAHPVAVHPVSPRKSSRFFTLSLEQSDSSPDVHPIELLQACAPKGVVCYFTALSFHALTTQTPSHHTIAELVLTASPVDSSGRARSSSTPPRVKPSGEATRDINSGPSSSPGPKRSFNPLGTLLFEYQGVPYYVSRRESRRIPGVQLRYLDPRTMFRITHREQTLLDTLHRPSSCGGAEVVFEAWRTAIEDLNENQLAATLRSINSPDLWRRTAAMLSLVEYEEGAELHESLRHHRHADVAPIPLLPGMSYGHLDDRWMVLVPR